MFYLWLWPDGGVITTDNYERRYFIVRCIDNPVRCGERNECLSNKLNSINGI